MKLLYDDDLLEETVFFCATAPRARGVSPLQVRRFHSERESVYRIADPDERNAAFFRVNLEWFREWGLEGRILKVLAHFPELMESVRTLVFRKARMRTDEGGELYVSDTEGRNAVIALSVKRFSDDLELESLLNHELMHLSDMVRPAFAYSPDMRLGTANISQLKLVRERYRLLWDITIDGRLIRSKRRTSGSEVGYRGDFDRAFGFIESERRRVLFQKLWNEHDPNHAELMSIASDPRGLGAVGEPVAGAACPLCHCSTFLWADPNRLDGTVIEKVERHFPGWTPGQGLCSRCAEVFGTLHRSIITGPLSLVH